MIHRSDKRRGIFSRLLRVGMVWALKLTGIAVLGLLALLLCSHIINPRLTPYIMAERMRLGPVERDWAPIEDISDTVIFAVIGAEDAQFCTHSGVDWGALKTAIEDGGRYGASSITQQTVKNVFLWHGRSYLRKAFELMIAPMADFVWGKTRTLEIYLNVAEFGTGVFGVEAAAQYHFGRSAASLSAKQASQLIALLPNPKDRSVKNPDKRTRRYIKKVALNAEIVRRDDMAFCIKD